MLRPTTREGDMSRAAPCAQQEIALKSKIFIDILKLRLHISTPLTIHLQEHVLHAPVRLYKTCYLFFSPAKNHNILRLELPRTLE